MSKYFYPTDNMETSGNPEIDVTKIAIAAIGGFVLLRVIPKMNQMMLKLRSETAESDKQRIEGEIKKAELKHQYKMGKLEKEMELKERLHEQDVASKADDARAQLEIEKERLEFQMEKLQKEMELKEMLHQHEMSSKAADANFQLEIEKEKLRFQMEKLQKELELKEQLHQKDLAAKDENLQIKLEIEKEKRYAEEDRRATAEANASYRKSKWNENS